MGAIKDYMIGEESIAFNVLKSMGIYTEEERIRFFEEDIPELYDEENEFWDDVEKVGYKTGDVAGVIVKWIY